MHIEYIGEETAAQARSRYLKEMMHIRRVTAAQLSSMTGVPQRTIERYTSGRTDIAATPGLNVALISYVLSMNAYMLGGADDIKPGAVFMSDGKQVVVKQYDFVLYSRQGAQNAFLWSMTKNGLSEKELAEKAGVPKRVILDMTGGRTDIRRMRARTVFGICRALTFHPYFLYGLRDMEEYGPYLKKQRMAQEQRQARKEILEEAERIVRERAAQKDQGE